MLKWIAKYSDESEFHQFEGDKENLFKDIDQDNLVYFTVKEDDKEIFSLDLKTGIFYCNDEPIEFDGYSNEGEDYRLIFFRKNVITFNFPDRKHKVIPYLGYQFTDKDGNNQKIMLSFEEDEYEIHVNDE